MKLTGGLFVLMMLGLAAFQIGLALGQPWGDLAMGGAYPGIYPPEMRVAALVQVGIYLLITLIALTRARLILPLMLGVSRWAMWLVVALFAVGAVLNTITPSALERMIWLPYTVILLGLSLRLALYRPRN